MMLSKCWRLATILGLVASLWAPEPVWGQESQGRRSSASLAPAELPPGLVDIPIGQAVVNYESGDLTIKSHGAPLIKVLRSVCARMGAELDAAAVADEVVLGVVGPALPRTVLASMLEGSPYEFATAGSAENPNAIARVLVIPKSNDSKAHQNKDPIGHTSDNPDTVSAALQPENQPQMDAAASDTAPKPDTKEMLAIISQARAEAGQVEGVDRGDVDILLQEVEKQIKAGAADHPAAPITASATATREGQIRHRRRRR
jgi:hypothetical protein